ncbi:hypothetical protein pb186bvf_015358 [Paramecium bursaria]
MYNISPMRPVRQQPGPQIVSRSISPVSQNQYQTQPPPGMKTILKPKIYEAVEIPYQNFMKMPHNLPPNVDNELKQRIHQLENEVKQYKQQSHRSTPDQSDIINQLTRRIREMENSRPQTADATNKHLQEQCELYFNKFQQCELEKNELIHQLKQNEQHFINLQKYAQQSKEYENRLYHYQREVEVWKKKFNDLDDQRIKQIQELRDEYEKVYSQNFNSMKSSSEQRQKALEDEMHKNRQQLDNITKEAEKWRERCHKEDLDKMSYTQRISELEMVTLHCQKEIDRLTLQNIQKQQENDQLKQKLNQLEFNHIQVQQAGLEGEVKRQKEQLDARQREIDDLKKRNSDLEQQILKQKDKIIEYEFIKGKVNGLDQQLQDSERYKHVSQAQELEINQYKLKINKFETLIQDLRRNEHRLQGDIQRLSDLVRMKDEEITKIQSGYKRNMANLQSQINQFRQQYEKDLGMKQYNQKSQDTEDYSDQIMKLNEEIDHLKKERENLLEVIRQYSDTRDKQDNKSIVMMGEIERLNLLIKNKDEEIDHLQQTIEMLSSQLEQMVQQNDLMKKELDMIQTRSNSKLYSNGSQKQFNLPQHSNFQWN